MPCKHYKDALTEVAAAGAAPPDELRMHLDGCASCRAVFGEEQSLFAAIESGLHASANAEVPSSLLPRVRAELDEVVVPRFRWLQSLVFASAGATLAFAVFSLAWPRHRVPANVAKQGAVVAPAPQAIFAKINPERTFSEGTQIAAVRVAHSHIVPSSAIPRSVASSNPEVLVPPDEREGLARFVVTLNEHREVAAAFLAERQEKKDTLVTMDPLQISEIEIKPLESSEAESSKGAGEKQQ